MTSRLALLLAVLASACAARPPAAVAPAVTPATRLGAADELLAAGCLDCLAAAFQGYEGLRNEPTVGAAAAAGSVRAGVLLALREHELGLLDSGRLAEARRVLAASPALAAALSSQVDAADVLVAGPSGPLRSVSLESQTIAMVRLSQNQLRWAETMRAGLPRDYSAAYLWLSLGKSEEARLYAEKLEGDEQFGERAEELLKRLR